MKFHSTENFVQQYKLFPFQIQKKIDKALKFLLTNFHHPSLRSKKYDEARDIWQARADKNIRFYFLIKEDAYILLTIKKHPK